MLVLISHVGVVMCLSSSHYSEMWNACASIGSKLHLKAEKQNAKPTILQGRQGPAHPGKTKDVIKRSRGRAQKGL